MRTDDVWWYSYSGPYSYASCLGEAVYLVLDASNETDTCEVTLYMYTGREVTLSIVQ